MDQVIQTPEQQYYLSKLFGYRYTIVYKPGRLNAVADALSRKPEEIIRTFNQLTGFQTDFLDQLRLEQSSDEFYANIRAELSSGNSNSPYSIRDKLILSDGKLLLKPNSTLIPLLLHELHSTMVGGHAGVKKTLSRLSASFVWQGMRRDVEAFVRDCVVCHQTKYDHRAPAGLLQPIPLTARIWEDLTMDFIVGMPNSFGHTDILVVVDRLSKYAHFMALPSKYSAAKIAEIFAANICKLHGIPRSIISDRGSIFLSAFWRELFSLSGTILKRSTAYHPQTDGQTEVVNRTLEQFLRAFVSEQPKRWSSILIWAEWWYNTTQHSATKTTPFQIVYGRDPPAMLDYVAATARTEAVDEILQDRQAALESLRRHLLKAQERMKKYTDGKRRDQQFLGEALFWSIRYHSTNRKSGI